MNVGLRHFEAFLTIVRMGNFTRAATALNLSQPALTVQIRQLEEELGIRLFDRNTRRVMLTEPGREFVAPLERLLVDIDSIVRHASDFRKRRRGVVAVAALPSVAEGILPDAIREVTDRYEGVVVTVRDVVAEHVRGLVKTKEVDFGVGTLERPDPEIAFETLFVDSLCAFLPKNHIFRNRTQLRLADLAGQPLILPSRGSSAHKIVEAALQQNQIAARITHEPTHMSTALGMVRAGLGVAILPETAAYGTAATIVRIGEPSLTREIGILSHAARTFSPAADILAAALRKVSMQKRRFSRRKQRS